MAENTTPSNLSKKQLHSLRMKKGWETRKKNLAEQMSMFKVTGITPAKMPVHSEPRDLAIRMYRYVLATRITGDTSLLDTDSFRLLEQQFIKHFKLTNKEASGL